MMFDPSIHERVDDGDFKIGDEITLVVKNNNKFVWSTFYTVERLNDREMCLKGLTVFDRIRSEASAMYYARKSKTRSYELDQVLDADEELL